jgi:AraC-like DNA-binding protein/ligand-binding sensor protein
VKTVTFDDLVRLPVARDYEAAFRKATGVSLMIVPADGTRQRGPFGGGQNPFCALVSQTPEGCKACVETESVALQRAALKQTPQQIYCYAGLTVVAVPVLIGGQHVATLLSGQVLRREPTQRDFAMVAKMLGDGLSAEAEKKARQAYFATPVVTAERFQAIVELLTVFAQQLAESATRHVMAWSSDEPRPVALAKEFVQAHAEEELTLAQVAQRAHVSGYYFCKLFKKTTGMTLTEYIARVRIEKAKTMLLDPLARISEIGYAAGFGSIPQFNNLFKRYVGMAPSQYRSGARTELSR